MTITSSRPDLLRSIRRRSGHANKSRCCLSEILQHTAAEQLLLAALVLLAFVRSLALPSQGLASPHAPALRFAAPVAIISVSCGLSVLKPPYYKGTVNQHASVKVPKGSMETGTQKILNHAGIGVYLLHCFCWGLLSHSDAMNRRERPW